MAGTPHGIQVTAGAIADDLRGRGIGSDERVTLSGGADLLVLNPFRTIAIVSPLAVVHHAAT